MRISDWSSDVCSSDLCSRWNLPTGKSVVRICGFGGLIRIETERVERVEALACVVIEIKLAGLAITHCRIKHREPLRRGRPGSTSKMACARCGGRDVRHYTQLGWQGRFRDGTAGCDHLRPAETRIGKGWCGKWRLRG